LIMVVYYRLSGVLAVLALTLYVAFTLAGLALFGSTLTLPGLAGLVLSVGIAVDANVLIFERIREELQHGKLVRTAVDEGFKHAMSAIIYSNVSTALTAFILYLVGTGPVQGFAITLIIGIAASMVTAIFVVRTFYMIWLQRRPRAALGGARSAATACAVARAPPPAPGAPPQHYTLAGCGGVGPRVGRELRGMSFLAFFFSFIVTLIYNRRSTRLISSHDQ